MSILRDGDVIALKTVNGKFVSARKDGTIQETILCKEYERFTVEASKSFDGKIRFKTCHGTFLSAKDKQSNITQSQTSQDNELFICQFLQNKIDLCTSFGTYWSSSGNGYISQTSWCKDNEKFIFFLILGKVHPGDRLALKTHHGAYLTEDVQGKKLVQKDKCTSASVITIEKHGLDGRVILKLASGKFLSANKDGTVSFSTVTQKDEFFTPEYLDSQNFLDQVNFLGKKFVDVEPKLLSFKSEHGTYLSARRDGSFNFQTWCRPFEQFDFRRL